jgi:hypothetical protein
MSVLFQYGYDFWHRNVDGTRLCNLIPNDVGIIGMESPLPPTHPADLPP